MTAELMKRKSSIAACTTSGNDHLRRISGPSAAAVRSDDWLTTVSIRMTAAAFCLRGGWWLNSAIAASHLASYGSPAEISTVMPRPKRTAGLWLAVASAAAAAHDVKLRCSWLNV